MNLYFSKLGHYGRFGNCLFQISAVLSMAKKYNANAYFPEWPYERYFINPFPHGEMPPDRAIVEEERFNYYEWQLWEDKGNCDLLGYMQSEKYFVNIKEQIKEQFTLKPEVIQSAKDKLPSNVFDKETILMQVRRTDYVGCPHYYQIPVTYYIQALIEHFPDWQNMNLVFISDDIAYCKVHFECLPNAYFADVIDIEQIAIAGLCDHYIIANSSFGWWGAWLGEKPHSKIIHPGRLHAGKLLEKSDESDYWPERWTNFKKDNYKIDLTDCTFTIPVFHDHSDRKQNLDLSVCMLQRDFNSNYIIGEQGSDKFAYMEQWCKYIRFDDMVHFHRTKMLNDMAMMAETPYIANWDADIIIPPMQVYITLLKLRCGADMLFPYDGRFARLPREQWFKPIEKLLDIGAIGDTEPKGRRGKPVPESSVGGAVFFNKESFIEGGMENENMISFGPEDCERNDRFTMLGFRVERACDLGSGLGGCLYHINHWCGPDSSRRNPFFKQNHDEIDRIRLMSKEDLRLYVDTWPWRHKYTERYYRKISEGAIISANEVYKKLKEIMDFTYVIDIGCGVGEWCQGDIIYAGLDYKIPKKSLIIKEAQYINCDLEKEIFKEPSGFKYDLCLCLEVAEHISEERADVLIEMLCNLSDQVLFSAAIPMQGGTGHVNEKWQRWWEKKFNNNGFGAALNQPDIKNNEAIELWYRQNIVLYVKGGKGLVSDFVLPEYYEQIVKYLKVVTV